MTVNEIAKQHRVKPQIIYTTIKQFEILGKIKVKRQGRKIILDKKNAEIIKKDLERRGYKEV